MPDQPSDWQEQRDGTVDRGVSDALTLLLEAWLSPTTVPSDLQQRVVADQITALTERRSDAAVSIQVLAWLSAEMIRMVESLTDNLSREFVWDRIGQAVDVMESKIQ